MHKRRYCKKIKRSFFFIFYYYIFLDFIFIYFLIYDYLAFAYLLLNTWVDLCKIIDMSRKVIDNNAFVMNNLCFWLRGQSLTHFKITKQDRNSRA